MSPIYSYLCHNCLFETDLIMGYSEVEGQGCPACEAGRMSRVATAPSAPRGDFGTVRRNPKGSAIQELNFGGKVAETKEKP